MVITKKQRITTVGVVTIILLALMFSLGGSVFARTVTINPTSLVFGDVVLKDSKSITVGYSIAGEDIDETDMVTVYSTQGDPEADPIVDGGFGLSELTQPDADGKGTFTIEFSPQYALGAYNETFYIAILMGGGDYEIDSEVAFNMTGNAIEDPNSEPKTEPIGPESPKTADYFHPGVLVAIITLMSIIAFGAYRLTTRNFK